MASKEIRASKTLDACAECRDLGLVLCSDHSRLGFGLRLHRLGLLARCFELALGNRDERREFLLFHLEHLLRLGLRLGQPRLGLNTLTLLCSERLLRLECLLVGVLLWSAWRRGCRQAKLATESRTVAVTQHVQMFPLPSYQRRLRSVAPDAPGIRFQSGAPLKAGHRRGRGQPAASRPADIARLVATGSTAALCP